ncbi:MAG: YafY family protein [Pseudomonadota bacterium]
MRRASRLFDIIQILRRGKLVRARDLADELEVSERTIYRDTAALIASGVPIEGEAGVGYVLRGDYDVPPLMFNEDEIESIVLGLRIVQSWADHGMVDAAASACLKIEAVLPEHLKAFMSAVPVDAPANHYSEPITIQRGALRRAIRQKHKVAICYRSKVGAKSDRVIRPLKLSFYGSIWSVSAWCELRQDFRVFRLDLITSAEFLEEAFQDELGKTLPDMVAREAGGTGPAGEDAATVGTGMG